MKTRELVAFLPDKTYQLSYKAFLNLRIEARTSVNWELRAPHLNVITNDRKFSKVKDIITFFKNANNMEVVKSTIKEVDTSVLFSPPLNLNKKLWQGGNNLFFYCIYYGFRKNVVPYSSINEYIKSINKPLLYSSDYFQSLPIMSEDEIRQSLKSDPIIISKNCVIHGKHRVCAMMGQIIKNMPYIPVYYKKSV